MANRTAIVWHRQDLRLADNPALRTAIDSFDAVLPVFIWSPATDGAAALGCASRVWLHHSLTEFSDRIRKLGGILLIRAGDPREILLDLARETSAQAVFWNRRYEPPFTAMDAEVKTRLTEAGLDARSFKANLLHEPWEVTTNEGHPFRVFTPFWKSANALPESEAPLPEVRKIKTPVRPTEGLAPSDLKLLPKVRWDYGIENAWTPGERGARKRLKEFLAGPIHEYHTQRDIPATDGVSRLSPHLHFGEISPRQIRHALSRNELGGPGPEAFVRQLSWRDFAHSVLYNFPHTVSEPLQRKFASFQWQDDAEHLRAWQQGRTGYPIVDAGMKQLWQTGWMHNRVRMIAASFLVKDLLIDWREGAAWFHDTLVDADLANNTLGWQWAAGCGADAAPYFRIFNPTRQGEKFDPDGQYVPQWLPELAMLPAKWIHQPWEAPADVLAEANVTLGIDYPKPIVDHAHARTEALKRFHTLR